MDRNFIQFSASLKKKKKKKESHQASCIKLRSYLASSHMVQPANLFTCSLVSDSPTREGSFIVFLHLRDEPHVVAFPNRDKLLGPSLTSPSLGFVSSRIGAGKQTRMGTAPGEPICDPRLKPGAPGTTPERWRGTYFSPFTLTSPIMLIFSMRYSPRREAWLATLH